MKHSILNGDFQDTNISLWQKRYFIVLKSGGNILNIFAVGLKPPTLMYKINWDACSWILFLDIVVCGHLCLVLRISDNGFTEDKAYGIWLITNGGDSLCRYHCISDIFE